MTVLIVDDNAGVAGLLKTALEMAGYQTATSASGMILYQLQHPLPDLILLDIMLPEGDGRTFCSYVKNQATTRHIPVILCSAHIHVRDQWRDSGADDLLIKPFHLSELLEKMAKLLTSNQSDDSSSEKSP